MPERWWSVRERMTNPLVNGRTFNQFSTDISNADTDQWTDPDLHRGELHPIRRSFQMLSDTRTAP